MGDTLERGLCLCPRPGRLYQTHPSRGLHQQEPHFLQQPPMEWSTGGGGGGGGHSFKTTTLPPPSSSTSLVLSPTPVLSGCYNNYQNCTMVQSHAPCPGYGAYGTLAPKTLIFPVFVQVRTVRMHTNTTTIHGCLFGCCVKG